MNISSADHCEDIVEFLFSFFVFCVLITLLHKCFVWVLLYFTYGAYLFSNHCFCLSLSILRMFTILCFTCILLWLTHTSPQLCLYLQHLFLFPFCLCSVVDFVALAFFLMFIILSNDWLWFLLRFHLNSISLLFLPLLLAHGFGSSPCFALMFILRATDWLLSLQHLMQHNPPPVARPLLWLPGNWWFCVSSTNRAPASSCACSVQSILGSV